MGQNRGPTYNIVPLEDYPQNFLGFVQFACLIILFRRF
jgi:hypothetical protein